jgi:hypothetical protein
VASSGLTKRPHMRTSYRAAGSAAFPPALPAYGLSSGMLL